MPPPRRSARRPFVFVRCDLPLHPKLAEIDDPLAGLAGWLYVAGLCYAGEQHTDGHLRPQLVVRIAGIPNGRKWVDALVRVGLWHQPGHECPRCPQPARGEVIVHDYLDEQRSRAEAEAHVEQRRAAARSRWDRQPPDGTSDSHTDSHSDTDATSDATRMRVASEPHTESDAASSATCNAEAEAEAEALPTGVPKPLVTMVGRLAVGDARAGDPAGLPRLLAAWQEIAGPGVDLESEARAYLARYVDQPARDELSAWVGWLERGRRNRAAAQPDPPAPPTPPTMTHCPEHPDQPAGRCDACESKRVDAPADLTSRRRKRRPAPTREASA